MHLLRMGIWSAIIRKIRAGGCVLLVPYSEGRCMLDLAAVCLYILQAEHPAGLSLIWYQSLTTIRNKVRTEPDTTDSQPWGTIV